MSDNAGRTRATAVITVHKYEPSAYDEPTLGPVLTRIHVEESFSGDITGDGVVEFLQAARADGSASFVGIEQFTGELGAPSCSKTPARSRTTSSAATGS
jgi:hypothetical protein